MAPKLSHDSKLTKAKLRGSAYFQEVFAEAGASRESRSELRKRAPEHIQRRPAGSAGGVGDSGYGREGVKYAMEELSYTKFTGIRFPGRE